MIALDEARLIVVVACSRRIPVATSRRESVGCVLAEPVIAAEAVPPFANASMDGYAVRAADTRGAPVRLRVVDELPAGRAATRTVGPGEAIRIMTGAPIPDGADAVVMVEDTEPEGDGVVVNGVSLADVGPRLVVPGDARGGRYVSNVVTIKLAPDH